MRVNSKRIRYAMNGERSGSEYYGLKGVFCRSVNRAPSLCGFRGPPRPARTLSHRQLRFRKSIRDNRRQRKTSVRLTNTSLGMIISDKGMVRTSSGCSHFETVYVYCTSQRNAVAVSGKKLMKLNSQNVQVFR